MYNRNIIEVRQESNWICKCKKITKVRKIDLFLKFPKLNFINKRRIQNILFLLNDCIDCKAQNLIHQSDGSYSKICLPNYKCVYALRYSFVYH